MISYLCETNWKIVCILEKEAKLSNYVYCFFFYIFDSAQEIRNTHESVKEVQNANK